MPQTYTPVQAVLTQEPSPGLRGQDGLGLGGGRSALKRSPSALSACRMRRRWKKQPIRSLLCRRPGKWPKSAPHQPQTSLLLRKALKSGCAVGGPAGRPSAAPCLGCSSLAQALPPRAVVAGVAALPTRPQCEQRWDAAVRSLTSWWGLCQASLAVVGGSSVRGKVSVCPGSVQLLRTHIL